MCGMKRTVYIVTYDICIKREDSSSRVIAKKETIHRPYPFRSKYVHIVLGSTTYYVRTNEKPDFVPFIYYVDK